MSSSPAPAEIDVLAAVVRHPEYLCGIVVAAVSKFPDFRFCRFVLRNRNQEIAALPFSSLHLRSNVNRQFSFSAISIPQDAVGDLPSVKG
jgi:hypothetical protein